MDTNRVLVACRFLPSVLWPLWPVFVDQRTWPQRTLSRSATLPPRSRPRKGLEKVTSGGRVPVAAQRGAGSWTSPPSETNRVDVDVFLFCVVCVCVWEIAVKSPDWMDGCSVDGLVCSAQQWSCECGLIGLLLLWSGQLCLFKPILRSPPTPRTEGHGFQSEGGEGAGPTAFFFFCWVCFRLFLAL